jgi:phenylacetate-coenzyme A ligase PaaK-like adenylate-forming protein
VSVRLTPLDAWAAARVAGGVRPGRPLPAAPGAAQGPLGTAPRGLLDPAALRRHQRAALRATVALAQAGSSWYAERLAGIDAAALELDDLAALPFTTAADVREHGERMVCVPATDVERIVSLPTSGTSGPPKRLRFSAADLELTVDFFCHGMSVLAGLGDRVGVLLPFERPGGVGDLLRLGLERLGATPVLIGPVRDTGAALDELERERLTVVVGIPVQVLALARRGAQGRAVAPRTVLLSTDHASRALVAAIERAWGCRVFDHYGTTETGLGGAVECEAHEGLHLREPDLLFEVVDALTGRRLPDGDEGELVFTTLTREAMPLIRYRTGDFGRLLPGACPCGSTLRRLGTVRARLADVAALPGGGRLALADLDEALFALPGLLDFRARLGDDEGGERLAVEIALEGGGDGTAKRRLLDERDRPPARATADGDT